MQAGQLQAYFVTTQSSNVFCVAITGGLLACLSAMGTLAQIQSFLIDSKDSKDVQ